MTAANQLPPNGVPLREYIEGIIAAHDKRYEQRFADSNTAINAALVAQEKAVGAALIAANAAVAKAETAAERRFEGQNEFRAQLTDQAATFVRRTEIDAIVKAMQDKADERLLGTQSKLDTLNALIGAAMPRVEYESAHKDLINKVERLDQSDRIRTGRSSGFDATRVMIFAVIGALVSIVGIILALTR